MSSITPANYRKWNGKISQTSRQPDRMPDVALRQVNGKLLIPFIADDPDWIQMGLCPRGTNRWDRFWYHYHHGRLMKYPWFSVFVFSIWVSKYSRENPIRKKKK